MPTTDPQSPAPQPTRSATPRSPLGWLHARWSEFHAALLELYAQPALVVAWLRYAWRTQLALAVAVPALIFVAPAAVDMALDRSHPVSTGWPKKLVGIMSGERERRAYRRSQLLHNTRLSASVGLLLLFCYELPEAIGRGRRRRRSSDSGRLPARVGHRYRLLEVLGEGGVGTVHRAEDLVLGRSVALKELHLNPSGEQGADAESLARFREEAQALARVSHPNIVQVFDLVDDGDRCWIAMELVEGGDLDALLRSEGPLHWRRALDFVVPLAHALDVLHAIGIVHRDVKSLNVLLTAEGTPKLADFGLAKSARSSVLTQADVLMGSPAYLSPEQIEQGEAGPASDIYALGIVLYELLTGRLPFEGEPSNVLVQHAIAEPEPPSRVTDREIPPEIDALVLCMLEKRPESRPGCAGDIAKRCHEAGWRAS